MDPEFQSLTLQLADAAIRNSAREIIERVSVLRVKKKDQETIAKMDQIVNDLIADKERDPPYRPGVPGCTSRSAYFRRRRGVHYI
jgi:hypothetical protein